MATTEPATRPRSAERELYSDRHVVPVLVLEESDERARGRMREAGLLSIIFHLLLGIFLWHAPDMLPQKKVKVWTAQELIDRNRELTYLAMPKDSQVITKRPNTNIISDKDRIATSRHPALDRKTLDELRESELARRAAALRAAPAPAPPQQAQAATPPAPPAAAPRQSPPQMARLEPPPAARNSPSNAFGKTAMSAGSAIEQAARAAAAGRAAGGGRIAGGGGDYGGGLGGTGRGYGVQGNLEILSDTMGVDFGPYLERVLHAVRTNWYLLVPEEARAPLMKKGKVAIDFAIMKDGSVEGLTLRAGSGDVSLDRAAWGGITASNPFPPLPSDFGGQYLQLRFRFYYNPDQHDLQ